MFLAPEKEWPKGSVWLEEMWDTASVNSQWESDAKEKASPRLEIG